MRTFVRERVAPFVAVFIALTVVNGGANVALFSRGFGFMLSPVGTALGALFTLLIAGASALVLSRVKRITPVDAGLVPRRGFGSALLMATVAGVGSVVAIVAILSLTGAATLTWRGAPPWVWGVGILAFWLNAALQQIGLQSLWLSLRGGDRSTWREAVLPLALFVGSHAAISHAPLYLLNVALFGVATMLAFSRATPPSYAAPVGLHGGWNAAMLFFGTFSEPVFRTLNVCPPSRLASCAASRVLLGRASLRRAMTC